MRIWGSLTFLAASFVGGMVLAATSADAVPVMIAFGLFATLAAALDHAAPWPAARASPLSATELQEAAPKLAQPLFPAVRGRCRRHQSPATACFTVSSRSTGRGSASATPMIGLLWAWRWSAEVGIFLVFNRVFGSVSSSTVLAIAGVAAILRWIAFPLIEPLGLGVPGLLRRADPACAVDRAVADRAAEDDRRDGAGRAHRARRKASPIFANGFSMAAVTLAVGAALRAARRRRVLCDGGDALVGLG